MVVDGLARGSIFTVPPGRSEIGRLAGTAVTLPDATVSRRHAEVDRSAAGVRVRDLGSANGTYVNGVRLQGARELNDGDEVRVGAVILRFSTGLAPTDTARPPPLPTEGSTSPTRPSPFGDVDGPVQTGSGLGHRTTIRAGAFGDDSDDALMTAMAANLPRGGIAATKMTGQRALPQSAHRLLDSRILAIALQFLDEDLAEPFLAGLGKYRAIVKAAHASLADPQRAEVMVTLVDPYEITSTHRPYVALVVDDSEIARVSFEISLVFGLFETAIAVRRGAIESVECEACSLAITLTLIGWQEPLLHRKIQLPVRLPVRPPMTIPLAGSA
jgi:hypothetical protein